MTDFDRTLNKAVAELGVAKTLGPQCAEAALVQARFHINLALDDARRQAKQEAVCTQSSPTTPE